MSFDDKEYKNEIKNGYKGVYQDRTRYDGFDEYEDENDDGQKISDYYTQRRLQKNQMERKIRQSQMWLRRLQVLIRMVTIISLIYLGYALLRLPQWYLDKNVFNSLNNPSLEILNNKIVPSYKILAALRRTEIPHTPIYRLETDEIKNNIMKLEPVEDVYIRRLWFPARLQIIVKERIPVVTVSPGPNLSPVAFFAGTDTLIGRDYMPLPKEFKTIRVFSSGIKGDDYRHWDAERIRLIENIAKAVNDSSKEEVVYIDFRNPKDVYVKIKSVNIRLGDLDETVFERISRISSILPQIKTLDKTIKYVDLRWKNANYIKLG